MTPPAADTYSCPACGAEARWHPARRALVCRYCGTAVPGHLEADADGRRRIVEHDLGRALRSIPDEERGWQADKTALRCTRCGAISVLDAAAVAERCDFCDAPALVPYAEVKDAFRPESLVPLTISEPRARALLRAWYASRWLAPRALSPAARTGAMHGVYLPYWTFNAHVTATWTAEAGYYDQPRRRRERDDNRREPARVRWRRTSGTLDHVFAGELVPASRGVAERLLRRLEPFPLAVLVPYDPRYLAGWTVERYQIDLVAAAERARGRMEAEITARAAALVPGDTHRRLSVRARFSAQTFKHILVPVWLASYRYGARRFQVAVNGYTGRVAGGYPKSPAKIALLVLLVAALIAALLALAERREPPPAPPPSILHAAALG